MGRLMSLPKKASVKQPNNSINFSSMQSNIREVKTSATHRDDQKIREQQTVRLCSGLWSRSQTKTGEDEDIHLQNTTDRLAAET
ncbi:hypothetical protein BaRGS_00000443 [Batillaria attramentaria]|uniref:Uncharacterized protein n=1 Tax=Batillaria attramentaria TaxID=370345 RepID=A0ABD0M8P4_9CAEN